MPTSKSRFCLRTVLAFVCFVLGAVAWAQEFSIPGVPADGNVSVEQLESAVSAVEARQELDEDTRARVVEQLRDAESQIRNRAAAEAASANSTQALETAPAETADLRQQLEGEVATVSSVAELGFSDESTLEELEQALTREMAELTAVEARLAELESQI